MTKANRKKIAKELLAAAERIERKDNSLCCHAIEDIYARRLFEFIFKFDALNIETTAVGVWFQALNENIFDSEVRSRRILGLCWASLMAEEGVF